MPSWIRERKWHRTARIQEAIDGSVVLRLKVPVSGELQRWVLQFGSEAEVLKSAAPCGAGARSDRSGVGSPCRA